MTGTIGEQVLHYLRNKNCTQKNMIRKHTSQIAFFFVVVLMIAGTAFRILWNSPVKGSVSPGESATRAWVISATDTLNAPVVQDNFMINNVKPGNYTLLVQGKPPFKDSFKENVVVVDGQPTDVGVIQMNK